MASHIPSMPLEKQKKILTALRKFLFLEAVLPWPKKRLGNITAYCLTKSISVLNIFSSDT